MVLVGPGGAGKTMLIEAILAATGAISRPGSIENGTTVCDFEDVETRVGPIGVAGGCQHRGRIDPTGTGPAAPARCGSTWSTPPATPISSVNCGPACEPPTPRCS